LATMGHHREMGRSGKVDFDGCDPLLSRQLAIGGPRPALSSRT
jgi:hypothetical protein